MSHEQQKPAAGSSPDFPHIGRILDRKYAIHAPLGSGGVGAVYRARHAALDRDVAVKIMHEAYSSSDDLRRRFEREARILNDLSHPNIVSIKDYGTSQGTSYLVMELLEGRTLATLLDTEGPPDPEVGVRIIREMLRGLAFAHAQGVVHRDLKPMNVFLVDLPDQSNHVKLLDFGLAKIFDTEDSEGEPTLTRAGVILGTPAYMSPEQGSGSAIDERTDVYAVGVMLFEILTGRFPFEGTARSDVIRAHMLDPVPTLASRRPELRARPELEAVIQKAMAKAKGARYANAAVMLEALDAIPTPVAEIDAGASKESSDPSVPNEQVSQLVTHALASRLHAAPESAPSSFGRERTMLSRATLGRATAVVVAVAVLAFVGVWGFSRMGTEPEASRPASPPERAETSTPGAAEPAAPPADIRPSAPLPPARDPFAGARLPASYRAFHRKVFRGEKLTRTEMRELREVQKALPEDPRPSLILAHAFVDQDWADGALERYELAFALDPSSRGDARMLRDLLRMVRTGRIEPRPADTLLRVYGVEALPETERQASDASVPPAERARLEVLVERLKLLSTAAPPLE